jgi:hypothetical protein
MYVTYDLPQKTRGDNVAKYPKVKRVYIAGKVTGWKVGQFEKKSGREVYGVKVDYEQQREGYSRKAYTAHRQDTGKTYEVPSTQVEPSVNRFSQIVELPEKAENIQFHSDQLPEKYREAEQNVR